MLTLTIESKKYFELIAPMDKHFQSFLKMLKFLVLYLLRDNLRSTNTICYKLVSVYSTNTNYPNKYLHSLFMNHFKVK